MRATAAIRIHLEDEELVRSPQGLLQATPSATPGPPARAAEEQIEMFVRVLDILRRLRRSLGAYKPCPKEIVEIMRLCEAEIETLEAHHGTG